jgi:hypothetical protein
MYSLLRDGGVFSLLYCCNGGSGWENKSKLCEL